jgi:hypothetical protein
MKEVIYLVVDKYNVKRMTKNLPSLNRGEIPVKLILAVDEKAFREPVITKEVHINDWQEGMDVADVEFRGQFITQEEADVIKARRLEKMVKILEDNNYTIIPGDKEEATNVAGN